MASWADLLQALKGTAAYENTFDEAERTLLESHLSSGTVPNNDFIQRVQAAVAEQARKLQQLVEPRGHGLSAFWAGPTTTITSRTYQPHFHDDFTPVIIPLTRNGHPYPIIVERWNYTEARDQLFSTPGFHELTAYKQLLLNPQPDQDPVILLARGLDGEIEAVAIRVIYSDEDVKRVAFVRGRKFDRDKKTEIKFLGIAMNAALLRHLKAKGIWHSEDKGPIIEGIIAPLLKTWRERLGFPGPIIWDDSIGAHEANYYLNDIGLRFIDVPTSRQTTDPIRQEHVRTLIDYFRSLKNDFMHIYRMLIGHEGFETKIDQAITHLQRSGSHPLDHDFVSDLRNLADHLLVRGIPAMTVSPLFRIDRVHDNFVSYYFKPMEIEVLENGKPVMARVDLLTPHEAKEALTGDLLQAIKAYSATKPNCLVFVATIDGKVVAVSANEITRGPLGLPQMDGLKTLSIEPDPVTSRYKRLSFALMLARLNYFQQHGLLDHLKPEHPLIRRIEKYATDSWKNLVGIETSASPTAQHGTRQYSTWSVKDALRSAEVWKSRSNTIDENRVIPQQNPYKIKKVRQLIRMASKPKERNVLMQSGTLIPPWAFTAQQGPFQILPITK